MKFNKPRKGVDKDEPPKNRFVLFFIILYHKFWKLTLLNIIYFACLSPLLIFILLQVSILLPEANANGIMPDIIGLILGGVAYIPPYIYYALLAISVTISGPLTAGLVYVLRNYSRREYAWPVRDMFDRAMKNFVQAFITGIIDVLFTYSFITCVKALGASSDSFVPLLLLLLSFVVWQVIKQYIYVILVTFKLKYRHILKNSVILTFAGARNNLIMVLASCFVSGLTLCVPIPLLPMISLSLAAFIGTFCTYYVVAKYFDCRYEEKTGNR